MEINNFKKVIKSISIFLFILLLNLNLSLAQDNAKVASQNIKETADNITNNILTSVSTLLMTAAFVVFFYGVVMFIWGRATGKDGNDLKKGKEFMMWGLIALFVMVSVWGIIKLAQGLLDVESNEIKIQPVKFAALDTSSYSRPDTNPLKQNNGTSSGDGFKESNVGVKKLGEECVGLKGKTSQCVNGLFCRNGNGGTVEEGSPGTCQGNPTTEKTTKGRDYIVPGDILAPATENELFNALKRYNCVPSNLGSFGYSYDEGLDSQYVEEFQRVNGLIADGKIGDNTWDKLKSIIAAPKSCQTCTNANACGLNASCMTKSGVIQMANIGVTGVCITK